MLMIVGFGSYGHEKILKKALNSEFENVENTNIAEKIESRQYCHFFGGGGFRFQCS